MFLLFSTSSHHRPPSSAQLGSCKANPASMRSPFRGSRLPRPKSVTGMASSFPRDLAEFSRFMALKTFKKRRKIDIPRVRICHDIFVKSLYIYKHGNLVDFFGTARKKLDFKQEKGDVWHQMMDSHDLETAKIVTIRPRKQLWCKTSWESTIGNTESSEDLDIHRRMIFFGFEPQDLVASLKLSPLAESTEDVWARLLKGNNQ